MVHTHICLDIFLAQKHTSPEERSPFPNLSSSPSLSLFHFALFSRKCMPYIALMGLIIIFQCYGIITSSCDVGLQCHYIIKKSYYYFENRAVIGSVELHILLLNMKKVLLVDSRASQVSKSNFLSISRINGKSSPRQLLDKT